MNFFKRQDETRRSSRRLVVLFLLAVVAVVVRDEGRAAGLQGHAAADDRLGRCLQKRGRCLQNEGRYPRMGMAVDVRLREDESRLHCQRKQGNETKARMSPQEAHRISRGGAPYPQNWGKRKVAFVDRGARAPRRTYLDWPKCGLSRLWSVVPPC